MEKIFFILVFLTPLVIVPHMELGWEVGKVFWLWTVIEFWLVYRVACGNKVWRSHSLWYAAFLWLGIALLSSHLNQGDAFWGGWWRRQGLWFMAHLVLLWSLIATSPVSKTWISRTMLVTGLLAVIIGMTQLSRTNWVIYEANTAGLISTLVLILATFHRYLKTGLLALLGLALSQSRAAITASVVLIRKLPSKTVIFGSTILLLVFILATLSRGTGERWQVWQDSIKIWSSSPWIGIGLDNYYATYTQMMKIRGIELVRFDQPHNLLLWLLISIGSFGTAAFVGWLYLVLSTTKNQLWIQLAVAIIIFGLFQPLSTVAWMYLFVVLGAACAE